MTNRFSSISSVLFLLAYVSCNHSSSQSGIDTYDYLFFVRQGGGDKVFTVHQESFLDAVSILVIRIQSRDTLVHFLSSRDTANAVSFSSLDDALHGNISIEGDYHQPTLPTGTWAHLYMVRAGQRFEITNTDLRTRLLGFETLVEDKLPQPH